MGVFILEVRWRGRDGRPCGRRLRKLCLLRLEPEFASSPSFMAITKRPSISWAFSLWRWGRDSNPGNSRSTVFKTAAFDHSATPPEAANYTEVLPADKRVLWLFGNFVLSLSCCFYDSLWIKKGQLMLPLIIC